MNNKINAAVLLPIEDYALIAEVPRSLAATAPLTGYAGPTLTAMLASLLFLVHSTMDDG